MKFERKDSIRNRSERHANDMRKTDEMTSASRSYKLDVVKLTERGLVVEEVNAVDVVQEIVEITVGSGSCPESVADAKEGC